MKNLIITLGILLLMTMGMVYDGDCTQAVRSQRQLKWICREMADAAAVALEDGKNLGAAELAAEEVLRRNTENSMAWRLEQNENLLKVTIDAGPASFRLPFLDNQINLSYCAETEIDTVF